MSSAADTEKNGDEAGAGGAEPEEERSKKPRTLLEAAKELKKATANLDAGTLKQMKAKEEEHARQLEAAEAELDAEEAEHAKHISQSIDTELVNQTKEAHRDILNKVGLLAVYWYYYL